MSVNSLYTFLWCIYKARNDSVFYRKTCNPPQVYAEVAAVMKQVGAILKLMQSIVYGRRTMFPNRDAISRKHHHFLAAVVCG